MATRITTYKHSDWDPTTTKAKVRGGALATQASRNEALRSQVRILAHGRRVVANVGLHGQPEFLVPDGIDPVKEGFGNPGTATQQYPTASSSRVLDRRTVRLTPGYRLAAKCIFAKSGPVQYFQVEPGNAWFEAPLASKLVVSVTYRKGGSSVVVSHEFHPPWGNQPFNGLPTGQGGAWADLLEKDFTFHHDETWTENVTADIVIWAYGGCRPVDIVIYETPLRAIHDEDAREGTCSSFPPGGDPLLDYAISGRVFPGNATHGSVQASKSARDQMRVWGPMLFAWSCWDEVSNGVTATEGAAIQIVSTSFRSLKTPVITAYNSTYPGASMSSGGYGRLLEMSGDLELRGKVGVVPVLIRAYARMTSAGPTGTLRFTTAPHSLRDLSISGTSWGWYEGFAWLQCSVHASVPSTMQVLAKVSSGTLEVRYISVEHFGNYTVAE